jgi:hypothetical protein
MYSAYNLEYYHSHKVERAAIMKTYYAKNAEALKLKRRQRYQAQKTAAADSRASAVILT